MMENRVATQSKKTMSATEISDEWTSQGSRSNSSSPTLKEGEDRPGDASLQSILNSSISDGTINGSSVRLSKKCAGHIIDWIKRRGELIKPNQRYRRQQFYWGGSHNVWRTWLNRLTKRDDHAGKIFGFKAYPKRWRVTTYPHFLEKLLRGSHDLLQDVELKI